jgi:hypothetical protein
MALVEIFSNLTVGIFLVGSELVSCNEVRFFKIQTYGIWQGVYTFSCFRIFNSKGRLTGYRKSGAILYSINGGISTTKSELIKALDTRYPRDASIEDFGPWDDVFANAIRKVYQKYRNDMDICTIFAEAIMNRTPWKLWDLPTGKPAAVADTLEAIEILEKAFDRLADQGSNKHLDLLHMYIHLMEMSPYPEKALNAGNILSELVPDTGHLLHMATHIDVLCGDYQNVVLRNHKAIQADKKYLTRSGPMNFYSIYRCHNYHFKIYRAMFLGQRQVALDTADELSALLIREIL